MLKAFQTYSLILFFCFCGLLVFSQNNQFEKNQKGELFAIRGTVYEQGSREPIEAVDVLLNNGTYTKTDKNGKFTIKAKIGDELTVIHQSFETIFYKIQSGERIAIAITSEGASNTKQSQKSSITERFNQMIDSADVYLKKDAEKSIKFIGDALDVNISVSQSAEAHELLGDIYVYWKQHDLAIPAYSISIENAQTASAKLKLARAYFYNDDIQKSISTYYSFNHQDLSNYNKVVLYEGLGDANTKRGYLTAAIEAYKEGLTVIKKHAITPKITDLNSKIAQAYNQQGDKESTKKYFSSSLDLAEQTSKKRAVEEKIKVAEFNSDNENYESEITLRKEALQDQVLVPKTKLVSGKITIPQLDGFEILETDDIMFCEADDNYTEIYLTNNKKKLVSKTLKYIEESLKYANFARVHKSYLVNLNEIVKYVKGKGGSVVLSNEKKIMVSASKNSDLLSYFK